MNEELQRQFAEFVRLLNQAEMGLQLPHETSSGPGYR